MGFIGRSYYVRSPGGKFCGLTVLAVDQNHPDDYSDAMEAEVQGLHSFRLHNKGAPRRSLEGAKKYFF